MLRTVKYGLNGAVLAGLIAAPVLWVAVDKSVDLVVDGQGRTVHTTASNVGALLADRGYRVTSHDLVAPSASAALHDGARVVLRRGRLLKLDVDGRPLRVWTTAPTVASALGQLGYPAGDFVSVSRSRRLPLSPTAIAIRTPRTVTVVHDGQTDQVTTTDATVGELLTDLGITLDPDDRLSAATASPIHVEETIRLQRVQKKLVSKTVKLKYSTTKRKDAKLTSGITKIVTQGKNGKARVTYAVVYIDGKAAGRAKVSSTVLAAPRTEVLKVGTKAAPVSKSSGSSAPEAPAPSPGSAKAIAKRLLAKRGWGNDQYDCLVTLWNHESGWRVHAANPSGAYGIPQALPGSKMGSAGPDWQDSAETQIKWGLGYIAGRYGNPCDAWSTWQAQGGWYY
ncbi:ubiquitin-like domain-containing protein [uncultured Jatrophihabitans sp.]|uniref:aggregation-promoting factor C-terminal-like domain-containing protein n=1 Tax=uncultured Jatrophihabitans sp. TaxID=1610747 RepID=UPI0035C999DB